MVTFEQAKYFCNPQGNKPADDTFIQECLDEATELVNAFIGTLTIPDIAKDRAVKETLNALYLGRVDEGQFGGQDGQFIRPPRDPMAKAYPILGRYMVIGL